MPVNRDKPDLWKEDVNRSVDLYNSWFLTFAPAAYRDTRAKVAEQVKDALVKTTNLTDIKPETLRDNPGVLAMLRMATAPPIAQDRLVGLAGVPKSLITSMEGDKENPPRIPPRMSPQRLEKYLMSIAQIIMKLADEDLFPWLQTNAVPGDQEAYRASTVVADRLCGTMANPIIRNAQEQRQLAIMKRWLEERDYTFLPLGSGTKFHALEPGTFAFHLNVPVAKGEEGKEVNVSVDVVVQPKESHAGELPLMIEAKSAGDFTNVNKRRKEEADKYANLKATYSGGVRYILFLCGYFDTGYLGYGAAEGIDWVWEHRIDDLEKFGL